MVLWTNYNAVLTFRSPPAEVMVATVKHASLSPPFRLGAPQRPAVVTRYFWSAIPALIARLNSNHHTSGLTHVSTPSYSLIVYEIVYRSLERARKCLCCKQKKPGTNDTKVCVYFAFRYSSASRHIQGLKKNPYHIHETRHDD